MIITALERATTATDITLFEWVNEFVGDHVECTDIGEDISYQVELSGRTGECVVVVECACGVTARTLVRSEDGRALITTARRHGLRAREVATAGRA